ncbi:diguanylate cyclase [Maricurvus nonylphenolicus]|uniref:diguanylate cyclase n=1 Tax=Maricurvus nonylphenolicus TaxID=1008307 RepID=UPI0036F1F5A2
MDNLEAGTQLTGLQAIWHDPEGEATLEQAWQANQQGKFKPLDTAGSTGLQPGSFWSYFILRNTTSEQLRLHLEYVDHQLISLQAFDRPLQAVGFQQIADLFLGNPFSERPVSHNRFVVEVELAPAESREVLVRYNSDRQGYVYPSMRIWTPAALQASLTVETGMMAFLFGGFFLMSIFALVAGLATNEKTFYAYSVYSLSKITVWGVIMGYAHQYVITENFHWSYMSISGAVTIFCALFFARLFLQSQQFIPKLDKLLILMMANAVFLFITALFKLTPLTVMSMTFALFMYPIMVVVGFARWRQGSKEAAVFILAWGLLIFGLVTQVLRDVGVVAPSFVNYYWPPLASFTEMLTIMAAMGIKVHMLRVQKEHAEKKYLRKLEESKEELRDLVEERTHELKQAKLQAEMEARTDYLTGIDNRRSFINKAEMRLSLALRREQPLSMLMMDLDRFKAINDSYGHDIGDQVLKAFSEVVKNTIRSSDIFGRMGGEEFALLFDESAEGSVEMAERLRQEVERITVSTPKGDLQFTTSIGVAHLGTVGTLESMLKQADIALYSAKENGRNQVVSQT